jgi:hypothetical protein
MSRRLAAKDKLLAGLTLARAMKAVATSTAATGTGIVNHLTKNI